MYIKHIGLDANMFKWVNKITLQKDHDSFFSLIIIIFSYERIFEWNHLQHVIKNTYSFSNTSYVLC
jgi:hypothetical protein